MLGPLESMNLIGAINFFPNEIVNLAYNLMIQTTAGPSGVSSIQVEHLSNLLGFECDFKVRDKSELNSYYPFILECELSRLRRTLHDKPIFIIHDASPYYGGDIFAVLVRTIDDECRIHYSLLLLAMEDMENMSADCVNKHIAMALARAGVDDLLLIGGCSDAVAYNVCHNGRHRPKMTAFLCHCHLFNNCMVGSGSGIVEAFTTSWLFLSSKSHKFKTVFEATFEVTLKKGSNTRWHGCTETREQIYDVIDQIPNFVNAVLPRCAISNESTKKMKEIVNSKKQWKTFKKELRQIMEVGNVVRSTSRILERSGFVALQSYDVVMNLKGVLEQMVTNNPIAQDVLNYLNPREFTEGGNYYEAFRILEGIRIFDPFWVASHQNEVEDCFNTWCQFDSNSPADEEHVRTHELPQYIEYCVDVVNEIHQNQEVEDDYDERISEAWRSLKVLDNIPIFIEASDIVLTYTPSSAAIERIFSILTNVKAAQKEVSLMDRLEADMMIKTREVLNDRGEMNVLGYNPRKKKRVEEETKNEEDEDYL